MQMPCEKEYRLEISLKHGIITLTKGDVILKKVLLLSEGLSKFFKDKFKQSIGSHGGGLAGIVEELTSYRKSLLFILSGKLEHLVTALGNCEGSGTTIPAFRPALARISCRTSCPCAFISVLSQRVHEEIGTIDKNHRFV